MSSAITINSHDISHNMPVCQLSSCGQLMQRVSKWCYEELEFEERLIINTDETQTSELTKGPCTFTLMAVKSSNCCRRCFCSHFTDKVKNKKKVEATQAIIPGGCMPCFYKCLQAIK